MFLYSIYHQRAGNTNRFHMRGGRFHAENTLCIFIYLSLDIILGTYYVGVQL